MAKSIKDIKIEDAHELFDSSIYHRGEEYFEEDLVKSVEMLDSSTIIGTVKGNQNYKVTITIDSDEDITCECSCPCDFNCKHAAALFLKWISVKGSSPKMLKDAKTHKIESINDILNNKSKDELIELLKEFLLKHPEMKQFVKLDKKEFVSRIKDLFSDFVDWDGIHDLISQLETILEGIKRNKSLWNREILDEVEKCAIIMAEGQENVHDEGDLGLFLEDWFLLYGEMFSSLNPSIHDKREFLQKIINLLKKDQYGLESSYEKAFLGMCSSKEDIALIKKYFKPTRNEEYEDEDYYTSFYLELYDKLGLDSEYLENAKKEGDIPALVDKLILLEKLDEALKELNNYKEKETPFWSAESKKLEILKKLGREDEFKNLLFERIKKYGNISDAIRLKKESGKQEWQKFLVKIIADASAKNRNDFLSRLYYHEENYKSAYEYSKSLSDLNYLELLAKKLTLKLPEPACEIYKKMCFKWIDSGSGWPYKKAGKMLEAIKIIDKKGNFYSKIKNEIIMIHKKKYSLMEIIKHV